MAKEEKLRKIAATLSPARPIRSIEFLRGRQPDLDRIVSELRYFHAVPFIYGHRGVGKTSLATTAAQLITAADRDPIYFACAPGSRLLPALRQIAEAVLTLALRPGEGKMALQRVDVELSLNPAIRTSFERKSPNLQPFDDVAAAVRVLRELDRVLPRAENTVVIMDELESLHEQDRTDLAYFIKQLGDQEFRLKFVLVGIAEDVHELIGAHHSVPRYIKEVSLSPLTFQDLMDIVTRAATDVEVTVPPHILYRIGIIANGFPHFAHLMGKSLLVKAVEAEALSISDEIYKQGVTDAVRDSLEELRSSYDAATQRREDYYKHLIWAMAHSDLVDLRIDEWLRVYEELAARNHWPTIEDTKLRKAISNFASDGYGNIIVNTPARYGSTETRYRYKRFASTLMRGHVRLNAENEGNTLGRTTAL